MSSVTVPAASAQCTAEVEATPVPARTLRVGARLLVQRVDTRGCFPLAPNYEGAIAARLREAEAYDLITLDGCETDDAALARIGIILHTTRCGSTLASRMLGRIAGVGMISESPAVADLLRVPGLDEAEVADALRRLVSLTLDPFPSRKAHPILRLPSWGVWYLPEILRAFPQAPVVVLHRDPGEIAVSQLTGPSAWLAAGWLPPRAAVADPMLNPAEHEAFVCAALARMFDAVAEAADARMRAVDYSRLVGSIEAVAAHLGISALSERDRAAVAAESALYSKGGAGERFAGDMETKRMKITPRLAMHLAQGPAPARARMLARMCGQSL